MTQSKSSLALACILPFVIYLAGSAWLAKLPTQWYWFAYTIVATTSALAAWKLLDPESRRQLIQPHLRIAPALLIGFVGIVLWIALSHLQIEKRFLPEWMRPADRVGFNPWEQLSDTLAIWSFILVRTIGISIVVPVVEELFWRAFLLRWTIDPDWQRVPIGTFSWKSCLIVTALFTMAHPEWLAASVYCLLMNGLMYWKKDLWQCMVAHGVSNLLLAIYVLESGNWWLW